MDNPSTDRVSSGNECNDKTAEDFNAGECKSMKYKAFYVPLNLRQLKVLLLAHLIPQDNIWEFMRIAHLTLDNDAIQLKVSVVTSSVGKKKGPKFFSSAL